MTHPVTKEELKQIRIDCKYPKKLSCISCDFDPCRFHYANKNVDEILSRPDPLALLVAWLNWKRNRCSTIYVLTVIEFIEQLRTNPSAVREQGIEQGWKE